MVHTLKLGIQKKKKKWTNQRKLKWISQNSVKTIYSQTYTWPPGSCRQFVKNIIAWVKPINSKSHLHTLLEYVKIEIFRIETEKEGE